MSKTRRTTWMMALWTNISDGNGHIGSLLSAQAHTTGAGNCTGPAPRIFHIGPGGTGLCMTRYSNKIRWWKCCFIADGREGKRGWEGSKGQRREEMSETPDFKPWREELTIRYDTRCYFTCARKPTWVCLISTARKRQLKSVKTKK